MKNDRFLPIITNHWEYRLMRAKSERLISTM